jgi:hypothetical protein
MKETDRFYRPVAPDRRTELEKFQDLNDWVRERGGWIISVPTEKIITIQCLPDSAIPSELEAQGYIVDKIGSSERILPHGITERFLRRADGQEEVRHHAGVVTVELFEAILP